jgi:hypothetical protein
MAKAKKPAGKDSAEAPTGIPDFEALIRKVGDRAMARVEEEVKKSPSVEELVVASAEAAKELNTKISLGFLGKRKTESWEEFEERAIQMFREKGLFKSEDEK